MKERQTDRKTDRQKGRHKDRQKDRQTERQKESVCKIDISHYQRFRDLCQTKVRSTIREISGRETNFEIESMFCCRLSLSSHDMGRNNNGLYPDVLSRKIG